MKYEAADIKNEQKKIKQQRIAEAPQKETNMKKKTTTEAAAVKQPKTIRVSTLVKAAAIVTAVVVAYIMGAVSANQVDAMLDTEAEARAAALLKSDGKQ